MLIQNIKPYYFQNITTNKNNKEKQNNFAKNQVFKNTRLISYPANYYLPVSFGRQLTHSEIIDKIGLENFPSPKIAEMFEDKKDKSLYEVHKEYYAPLLECKTLKEAKEKYPEFDDVIDAKEVNIDKFTQRHVLNKIKTGKIKGASLDNLSLDLLKKQYAQVKSTADRGQYFNMSAMQADNLFELLHIKKFDRQYYRMLTGSNPEFKALVGKKSKAVWQQDDGTRRQQAGETIRKTAGTPEARAAFLAAVQSDEHRKKQSRLVSDRWAADDGSWKRSIVTASHTPEAEAKRSVSLKTAWKNDEGTMSEAARRTASTLLQSEEVRKKSRAAMQTDEYREKKRAETQARWDADDGSMRRKAREQMADRWANDDGTMLEQARCNASTVLQSDEVRAKKLAAIQSDECRKKHSDIMHDRWGEDDGTMLAKAKNTASTILQSEEVKAKRLEVFHTDDFKAERSKMMLDLWADEEYRKTRSGSRKAFYQTERGQRYIEARKLAHKKHPEITYVRKKIAEEFPMLPQVLEHIKNGTASKIEETYLLSYEQRCEDAMPGYKKIIGDDYHKILVEWGLKEE